MKGSAGLADSAWPVLCSESMALPAFSLKVALQGVKVFQKAVLNWMLEADMAQAVHPSVALPRKSAFALDCTSETSEFR